MLTSEVWYLLNFHQQEWSSTHWNLWRTDSSHRPFCLFKMAQTSILAPAPIVVLCCQLLVTENNGISRLFETCIFFGVEEYQRHFSFSFGGGGSRSKDIEFGFHAVHGDNERCTSTSACRTAFTSFIFICFEAGRRERKQIKTLIKPLLPQYNDNFIYQFINLISFSFFQLINSISSGNNIIYK